MTTVRSGQGVEKVVVVVVDDEDDMGGLLGFFSALPLEWLQC